MAHNIITNGDNPHSGFVKVGLMDKKVLNKKNSLGDFRDQARPTAIRENKDYYKGFEN